MQDKIHHIINISGGKDSTALLILAKLERGVNATPVFADTGHEHYETYKYLEYLDRELGPIETVKAEFEKQINRKRLFIARDQRTGRHRNTGRKKRWSNKRKRIALSVLKPTGNPFLDLCLVKGRFPSTRRRFCSQELKHAPIRDQVIEPLLSDGITVISWQGVRSDESESRRHLNIVDNPEPGLITYRPIINYTTDDVFNLHRKHGIKWNPLYNQGMGRVGCMPCIHARKEEIRQISIRWPEVIDWIERMETITSMSSKRGISTFYDARVTQNNYDDIINLEENGIRRIVEWSRTTRGGKNFDILADAVNPSICSSIYGLCESSE